jgi:hypothetical protein
MSRAVLGPPHFCAAQMGRWHREAMTEGFFLAADTPPTRLRRATTPFAPFDKLRTKMGRTMSACGVRA